VNGSASAIQTRLPLRQVPISRSAGLMTCWQNCCARVRSTSPLAGTLEMLTENELTS